MTPAPPGSTPVLLYDGSCGVCARSVQFVLRRDHRRQSLRFASLESDFGRRITGSDPRLAGVDSLIWAEPAPGPSTPSGVRPSLAPGDPLPPLRMLVRSDAVIAVAAYLGGVWRGLALVGSLVPRPLRDGAYDVVARNRHRVPGRSDRCLLPTPAERERFLDGPDA
ncbi:MAG: DUF393 domain-containing protein [Gemmatimonadales bacterium]|nr:MAG: DUF393 domain-containing protein [Gemmatimonadales bacterium]